MGELKVHIQYAILWEFKNNKNTTETAKKISSVMAKVPLLTTKSETGFQSFILVIHHKEMNPDQDAHQSSIKMLKENCWNEICTKVLKN